jgi:nitrogen fixation protein FixH
MTAISAKSVKPITGWHVLVAVVLFFGVVIGVDTLFMVKAYGTFSGEVASNPYEAGLAFNKTLALRRREAALGWTAKVVKAEGDSVVVRMVDKAGAPLDHLSLTGVLERPATETGRQVLDFKPVGDGRYQARARLDGAWDLRATARNGRDQFELETRLLEPVR